MILTNCAECGAPVVEDPEYGGYVHIDGAGDLDRTDRGHYAEPEYRISIPDGLR